MDHRKKIVEIDLIKLLKNCVEKWWLFLLATIIMCICGYMVTRFLITPTYESSVQIYVHNTEISSDSTSVSKTDLEASAQLVDLYEALLNTDNTLDAIIENAELNYSYAEIKKMISTSSVNDTQIFMVTVTSTSPEEAWKIASTIGQVLPEMITEIIPGTDARVVSDAKIPSVQSAPSYSKNIAIAIVVGITAVFITVFINTITDTAIHSEEDLRELTEIPILAYFPDENGNGKKQGSYSKNKYYKISKKEN